MKSNKYLTLLLTNQKQSINQNNSSKDDESLLSKNHTLYITFPNIISISACTQEENAIKERTNIWSTCKPFIQRINNSTADSSIEVSPSTLTVDFNSFRKFDPLSANGMESMNQGAKDTYASTIR